LAPTSEPPSKQDGIDDREFDWADNADAIVLPEQSSTAIYFNNAGGLVIRQQRWPDDDSYIVISKTNISEFLDKLTDICGIPSFP
jgi:hypothetical protein